MCEFSNLFTDSDYRVTYLDDHFRIISQNLFFKCISFNNYVHSCLDMFFYYFSDGCKIDVRINLEDLIFIDEALPFNDSLFIDLT